MTYIRSPLVGPTADRPDNPEIGTEYFDTDLGYSVYWSGAEWVSSGAAPPPAQTATIEFSVANDTYDPNDFGPKPSVQMTVVTSDGLDTEGDITLEANVTGGTAVAPDDYTDGSPYAVTVPAGTASGVATSVFGVDYVRPNVTIPPSKTIILEIDALSVVGATVGAQSTMTITLNTVGGEA